MSIETVEQQTEHEELVSKIPPEIFDLIKDQLSSDFEGKTQIEVLKKISNAIVQSLPEPSQGYTRVWRGNRNKEVGLNPSYTASLAGIALPFVLEYKGPLSYVDVPEQDLPSYAISRAENAEGALAEYILPPELVHNANIVGYSKQEAQVIIANSEPQKTQTGTGWEFA